MILDCSHGACGNADIAFYALVKSELGWMGEGEIG